MNTKNAVRELMSDFPGSHPKPHAPKGALAARSGTKLNNKVLRNTLGPALVLAAWDQVAQAQSTNFTYTGGFQTWTVPATGVYRITAFGAGGGGFGPFGGNGGRGAEIGGDFDLTSGQVISIAVGGAGGGGGGPRAFGGGGGSFVTLSGNALVIAGGGGGASGGSGYGGLVGSYGGSGGGSQGGFGGNYGYGGEDGSGHDVLSRNDSVDLA